MEWSASDVIAVAAIVASAGVAITTVRMQHRATATSRRRDAHLRAWHAGNAALRAQQEWLASMEQPRADLDRSESADLGPALQAFRDVYVELEILSPRVAKECSSVLAALELSRGDLRELAGVRREMSVAGPSGGAFGRARTAARDDLNAARLGLNRIQRVMSHYERTGALLWWAGRRTRHGRPRG
jgi:hypothetical protein